MSPDDTPPDGNFAKLIDEQLELAAAKLPALEPAVVHPSPEDHDEVPAPQERIRSVPLVGETWELGL